MDPELLIAVVMRWLHVVSAVVGVGGSVMMRLVILPALDRLPNGDEVLKAIRPTFKRIIHSAIGTLLLTGLYNYVVVAMPKIKALKEAYPQLAVYHRVMGLKIFLSLALFVIAFMLLKPVPAVHEKRKSWLSVNVVLGLLIMLLAAYLRRVWPVPAAPGGF
jgi:putative copper export protein